MNKSKFLKVLLISTISFNASTLFAQTAEQTAIQSPQVGKKNRPSKPASDIVAIGLGLGFDYGGIGGNFTIYPLRNLGFFGGMGYTTVGLGYTGGIKARLLSNKKPAVSPFLVGMYGYYAAVNVKNAYGNLNKQFMGYSVGIGFDTPLKPSRVGYWSFALLIPFRGTQVDDYVDKQNITLETKLPPFGISIGYKFAVRK